MYVHIYNVTKRLEVFVLNRRIVRRGANCGHPAVIPIAVMIQETSRLFVSDLFYADVLCHLSDWSHLRLISNPLLRAQSFVMVLQVFLLWCIA